MMPTGSPHRAAGPQRPAPLPPGEHIRGLFSCCVWDFSSLGLNPDPLHWEHRVLITGSPGKPLDLPYP